MQLSIRRQKSDKKQCVNIFYPGTDIFKATFPGDLEKKIQKLVDYWRPEGDIHEQIKSDYFFRELICEAEILITGWGTPNLPLDLIQSSQVKYICHVTGGMRNTIDKEILNRGILVSNWGHSISYSIADASLMLILSSLRRLGFSRKSFEAGFWDRDTQPAYSLRTQKVGLFGLGFIAQDLVRLLKPFKCQIRAYDPFVRDDIFRKLGVRRAESLEDLFRDSNVISLHAGMTPELEGIVNRKLLRLLPDDGVLVNTARGKLINEADLLAELNAGRLWYGADVFATEPLPPTHPFRYIPRCIVTPHNAGPTVSDYHAMGEFAYSNIRRYLRGEPVVGQVKIEQYDRMT